MADLGHHTLTVSLRGHGNETYKGTLLLKNLSFLNMGAEHDNEQNDTVEDPTGASYYVIAVVIVYGMSIVLLIASHINRKHRKLVEDKQIHKYLQEFQVVKEHSSRETYRNLKSSIMKKLNWERNPTYRNLSHVLLPAIAITVAHGPLDELQYGHNQGPVAPKHNTSISSDNSSRERRKGLAHLFHSGRNYHPPEFEHSVLDRIMELQDDLPVRGRAYSLSIERGRGSSIRSDIASISTHRGSIQDTSSISSSTDNEKYINVPVKREVLPSDESEYGSSSVFLPDSPSERDPVLGLGISAHKLQVLSDKNLVTHTEIWKKDPNVLNNSPRVQRSQHQLDIPVVHNGHSSRRISCELSLDEDPYVIEEHQPLQFHREDEPSESEQLLQVTCV